MISRILYTLNLLKIQGEQSLRATHIAISLLKRYSNGEKDQSLLEIARNSLNKIEVYGETDISSLLGCMEELDDLIQQMEVTLDDADRDEQG